jgi:hypothetical protein
VAGSLLHSAGLPELIAGGKEEYRPIVLRLAIEPGLPAACQARGARWPRCACIV